MIRFWKHPEHHHHREEFEKKEAALLEEAVKLEREERDDLHAIRKDLDPRLASIKVAFTEKSMGTTPVPGAPVIGPVVMNVGDVVVASVVGFDQNGQVFAGPLPAVNFSIDDSSIASLDPTTDDVAGVGPGVANLKAELTSDEGLDLTDTETVTVASVTPPAPVLSSIKIAFSPSAAASSAAKANARR